MYSQNAYTFLSRVDIFHRVPHLHFSELLFEIFCISFNKWQEIEIKTTNASSRDQLYCLSSVSTKSMDRENMTHLTKFYQTLSQVNQLTIYVSNP